MALGLHIQNFYYIESTNKVKLQLWGSSPFNYCRNTIYYTAADQKPPSIPECLRHLSKCDGKSGFQAFMYLQNRLRIGWGTARVILIHLCQIYKLLSNVRLRSVWPLAHKFMVTPTAMNVAFWFGWEMCLENCKSLEGDWRWYAIYGM